MSKDNQEGILIGMTSTVCGDCVFAEFKDDAQTGCLAGRLDLFEKANVEILETEVGGKQSKVIDGKMCVYYRNPQYGKDYAIEDKDAVLNRVRSELKIPYHVILMFKGNEDSSKIPSALLTEKQTPELDAIKKRLNELKSQKIPPKIVTVVDRSHLPEGDKGYASSLMDIIRPMGFDYWTIKTITAKDALDDDCIDLVYDSSKEQRYMFYTIFNCSQPIPSTFSEEIHKSLHDDMQAFVILRENSKGIGKTVLKAAHAKYNGASFGIPLEKKLEHYQDGNHLIKDVEELCPSLKTS